MYVCVRVCTCVYVCPLRLCVDRFLGFLSSLCCADADLDSPEISVASAPAARPVATRTAPAASVTDTQQAADDAEMAALMNGGDNEGTQASAARSMKCTDCGTTCDRAVEAHAFSSCPRCVTHAGAILRDHLAVERHAGV